MTCPDDEVLEDEPIVAECRGSFPAGRRDRVRQRLGATDRAHPLATATCRRLDQEREPDPLCSSHERVVRLVGIVIPREHWHPERRGEPPGRGLVAHRSDRSGWRADPADPGRDDRLGEVGVLGEEAEARVDRVGAGSARGLDDGRDVEQIESVRPVRVRDDRRDAEVGARAGDPSGDLATVGDEDGADGSPIRRPRRPRRPGVPGAPGAAMNASSASIATRHRPPTRRAGNFPLAIHRWTDRVVAPTRSAAWLGLSSSVMTVAIVAYPAR